MEELIPDDMEDLSIERFETTYETLKKSKGTKYQFIMKGGEAMKAALYRLCQTVWISEKLPDRWEKSTLIQLFKGKGLLSVLDNMRHLHIKDEFPKYFGHLVVSACKDKMISSLTKFQIATKPGHRVGEFKMIQILIHI